MKVLSLISGGKDSCFNMMHCVAEGHEIVALANLKPKGKDELDSYMYQTVGHHAVDLYAEAMGLPLYRRTIEGASIQQGTVYNVQKDDEVEDLFNLIKDIQDKVEFQGVSVGAILSDYQRVRVENVCSRLGLTPLTYLWRRNQDELLSELIACGVKAIIIKVAALGLSEEHLGKTLKEIQPHMSQMSKKYGLNPCGEGGEYETFTLDCPMFKKEIIIDEQEVVMHSEDAFAPVSYLNFKKMHTRDKKDSEIQSVVDLPLKRSSDVLKELNVPMPLLSGAENSMESAEICAKCSLNRLSRPLIYSKSCRSNSWCALSGLSVCREDDTQPVEQLAKETLVCLENELKKLSLSTSDLFAVHLYVSNMADFAKINSVYKTYFGVNPPIRVCVEAPLPGNTLLQMDCVAQKSNSECNVPRRTMHVQGLSHWAPANIGPYSQAVQIGDLIYVAGQIGLVPGSLAMVEGGIVMETALSLRHVDRVLTAMSSSSGLHYVRLAICYVINHKYIETAKEYWEHCISQELEGSGCGVLQCVVIPRLPRDALIEWQVYATTQSHQPDTEQCCVELSGSEYYRSRCTGQVLDTESTGHLCTLVCVTELRNSTVDCNNKEWTGQLWNTALKAIYKALQKLYGGDAEERAGESLTVLRIFYCCKHFKDDRFIDEYESAFSAVFGEQVSVVTPAFVPVVALEGENDILAICH